MVISFGKYEGAGNDFILIDKRTIEFEPIPKMVAALCDRHFGIGADGMMLLSIGRGEAEFDMRYFNSDGHEATMCGNGGRCITLFAHHLGIGGRNKRFSSVDGLHRASLLRCDEIKGLVELQMIDVVRFERFGDEFLIDTGSPHYIVFVDSVDSIDVVKEGRRIRQESRWKSMGGVNVNFVEINGEGRFRLRTYERGVEDETLACGTGATASAIATHLYAQHTTDRFDIAARGGQLAVRFQPQEESRFTEVWLKGPARKVFNGKFEVDNFIHL